MKTTKRFENAVSKLYKAFHNNELNAFDCTACAVGNICDNSVNWVAAVVEESHGCASFERYFSLAAHESRLFINPFGYSPFELHSIETIFMKGFIRSNTKDKNLQFERMCAVIEYLCELDNIPNVLDYTSLFETTEEDKPVNELMFEAEILRDKETPNIRGNSKFNTRR